MTTRAVTRPVTRAVTRPVYGGRYGTTGPRAALISALFGSGEQGIFIDPSDLSTMYQDSAGTTPVTADGDPVGRIEDLSGNGNHLTQTTAAARPQYKTDGTLHWLRFDGVDDCFSFSLPMGTDRLLALAALLPGVTDTLGGLFSAGASLAEVFAVRESIENLQGRSGAAIVQAAREAGLAVHKYQTDSGTLSVSSGANTASGPAVSASQTYTDFFNRGGDRPEGEVYGIIAVESPSAEGVALVDSWLSEKAGL